jgi:hypothetical protein
MATAPTALRDARTREARIRADRHALELGIRQGRFVDRAEAAAELTALLTAWRVAILDEAGVRARPRR